MELDLKPVEFFGHTITVNTSVNWLAVDEDGYLYAYVTEPVAEESFFWNCDQDRKGELICMVDLQGKDWRETKVKI